MTGHRTAPCLCFMFYVCRCTGECPCKSEPAPRPVAVTPRPRFVLRDHTLPHQIVLLVEGVSCNCRANDRGGYDVFAPLGDDVACWKAYDVASNHVGPFPVLHTDAS